MQYSGDLTFVERNMTRAKTEAQLAAMSRIFEELLAKKKSTEAAIASASQVRSLLEICRQKSKRRGLVLIGLKAWPEISRI